jgi:hypothetical protein
MATVVKNFRVKSGLIVEGTTGTINGQNILTETGSDSYILNLVGGATLVKSVEATQLEVSGAGKLSVKANVFDAYGSAATAITTAAADATSKANAAESAAIAAAATDATTKASSAQAAAIAAAATDATTKANGAVATAAADATTKANAARAAAEATAASALSSAISTEVSNRNTAISTAVDSLVDGAPALLNTLNELAAAINDDANYTTTITTALGTKANSADVTSAISTAASNAASDATTKANAAQAAAIAAAATDATTKADAAASAAAAANTAQQNGTTAFTALNVNDQAKQIAASSNGTAATAGTAYEWPKADYRSGKFLVKIDNATHNEISEILVTLDSSDNVAVTEYAIVGTNGSRGTITADVSGSNVRIRVTPVNNSTVKVSGTLIK